MMLALTFVLLSATPVTPAPAPPIAAAAGKWPTKVAGYMVCDFHFRSAETMAEIRLH